MTPLVTAIDRAYLPGLKALANSFHANAGPGFELYCMVYGDICLWDEVEALGVKAIKPPAWDVVYPSADKWPNVSPAMYARLLIPGMFSRAIWIDADCIIVKPIGDLAKLEFSEPVAAVHIEGPRYTLGFHIPNLPDNKDVPVPFSGLLVFNSPRWNELGITEACADLMNAESGLDFRFVVQSVLGMVLMGDYHRLPGIWQGFANRNQIDPNAKILHWVGALPWRDEMNNVDIWRQYA